SVTLTVTVGGSTRVDLHGAADVVEHAAQHVVVGVTHADVGVTEVARGHGLCRRTRVREMRVEHPLPVAGLDLVNAGVARDRAVPVRTQRDYPGGELPRRLPPNLAVHDRVGPLPVDVEVVARGVEVPSADPRRAAADLAELQPLRPEEPLHVRGAGADAERLVDSSTQLTQL